MSNMDATRVMGAPISGATMQMPAGGDAMRTQMGGTTTCPVCRSTTPLMEAFCGDCGYLLSSVIPEDEDLEIPEEEAAPAELVDEESGRKYSLRSGVNTVGRQGTDILSPEGTVSRNHATITVTETGVLVEDLGSSNGTKVGDLRLKPNSPTAAANGVTLKFGNWKLKLQASMPAAAVEQTIVVSEPERTVVLPEPAYIPASSVVEDSVELETVEPAAETSYSPEPVEVSYNEPAEVTPVQVALLTKQEGPSDDIALNIGVTTFGRRAGNDIVLLDPYLSGLHGEFVADETGAYLVDKGSTNGTFVNGQRLAANDRQLLLDGDEIQLGQTKYLYGAAAVASTSESAEINSSGDYTESDPV